MYTEQLTQLTLSVLDSILPAMRGLIVCLKALGTNLDFSNTNLKILIPILEVTAVGVIPSTLCECRGKRNHNCHAIINFQEEDDMMEEEHVKSTSRNLFWRQFCKILYRNKDLVNTLVQSDIKIISETR